ncbi:MAG: anion permease [Acidobacteriota bacterium]
MPYIIAVLLGLFLAYANGANDNFKGVATLFGTATSDYRGALAWATVTTALGSLTALVVARGLLGTFSGRGLVPAEVVSDPRFAVAVALSAGVTVLLATWLGFPISTTHALIGALLGAGWLASPSGVNMAHLGGGFLVPLLASPFIGALLTLALYPLLSSVRCRLGVEHETCVCVDRKVVATLPGNIGAQQAMAAVSLPTLRVGTVPSCMLRYRGNLLGCSAESILGGLHYVSAGIVSFARGLNDTPKIAALLLIGSVLHPGAALVGVGAMIAIGGVLSARRVAETMSHRVTRMNSGQGATANFVTGLIVVGASYLGLPVSTTHVSCGSLFGLGAATRQARWATIGHIVLAWIITLPLAAALAALVLAASRTVL